MALNIKNERACELATELAELTGETKTHAILVALEERLEKQRQARRKKATAEELLEIGRQVVREIGYQPDVDHAALLYDEHGLPK